MVSDEKTMKLLYISRCQFVRREDGIYALPAYGDFYWHKYLDVFDSVHVLGEPIKKYLNVEALAKLTDSRVCVDILPENTRPTDWIHDREVKNQLEKHIRAAQALLIKPSTRKGIMAIKLAKKYNKPYMIEMTGDLKLTLSQNPSLAKRLYGPILHKQTLSAIKDCPFGLYVTEHYLQKVYPIKGEQCGCTDTVILPPDAAVLDKRLAKIQNYTPDAVYKIGMVASYHDTRKGLDTALEALALLKDLKVELHVLGVGTEEDRNKWYALAEKHQVKDKLFFDTPLASIEKVLAWNDDMDLIILPSRSEGLPRCIVESISRACPCVVSDVCGLPELVDKRWVHAPADYTQLAHLIKTLLTDKTLLSQVANQNFKHAFNYTQEVLTKRRNTFLTRFKKYCEEKTGISA